MGKWTLESRRPCNPYTDKMAKCHSQKGSSSRLIHPGYLGQNSLLHESWNASNGRELTIGMCRVRLSSQPLSAGLWSLTAGSW